jgi:hypothetical protein
MTRTLLQTTGGKCVQLNTSYVPEGGGGSWNNPFLMLLEGFKDTSI